MKIYVYEGKKEDEILAKAYLDLKVTEEEVLQKKEVTKGNLFKGTTIKYTFVYINEITDYLKNYLVNILSPMNLELQFETSAHSKQISMKMYSNNNAILIGKNGKTLEALTIICKQVIFNQIGMYPYLNLDVENYKDKQVMYLERLARNIAREVINSNVEVSMENMNSYERRIVHNILTEFKGVTTSSEGDEPNRHVIVKPKKD